MKLDPFRTPLIVGLILVLTRAARINCDEPAKEQAAYEPQFPYLVDPTSSGRVKIVSESVDDKTGYKLQEEYLDLSLGRSAIVSANKDGNQVMYLNAASGKCYSYRPYSCEVKSIAELARMDEGLVQNWNHKLMVAIKDDSYEDDRSAGLEAPTKELRLFGVAGLWKFAEQRPKSFTRINKLVYSASKDIYQESICWTVQDATNKLSIKFHFIEGPPNQFGAAQLSLEMIQIESMDKDKRVLRTINVLSIDKVIDEDVYDDYLDIPVGYGCFERQSSPVGQTNSSLDRPLDNKGGVNSYWNSLFLSAQTGLVEFEVTATKFDSSVKGATVSRSSDTMSIQVAHTIIDGFKGLNMIRMRSTDKDTKIFTNYKYKVKYSVDLRRGTCKMSHVRFQENKDSYQEEVLRFNNGLELDVVRNHFDLFDYSTNPFHFIKKTRASLTRLEQDFYENTAEMSTFRALDLIGEKSKKIARIIRSYTKSQTDPNGMALSSVSIWVLNEEQNKIEETYQINVIESKILSGWPEEPRIFDVSEECYLNSESNDETQHQMKSGRDYAWVELTYPTSSRVLSLVAANEMQIKRHFYENYLKIKGMDFTRVPRLELLFDNEDSFVIRMLLLDTPPLEFVYDRHPGQVISLDRGAGDSSHMAPDVSHCAELCRLSYCTMMSFCHGAMSCLLSSREFDRDLEEPQAKSLGSGRWLSPMDTCDTYSLPFAGVSVGKFDMDYFHANSLHGILSRLQHQDYSVTNMPKVPDELALPRDETSITDQEYDRAMSLYMQSIISFLKKESVLLPELTITTHIEDHFFISVPNKFEVENDPLRDFDIIDKDSMDSMSDLNAAGDSGRLPAFHQGLPMFRYKVNPMANAKLEGQEVDLSLMNGLSYDQCALACLDGRCGSFSYCKNRRECILSSVNTTGRAQALEMVEQDPECFIAQRDFLGNFVKFTNAYRPQLYDKLDESVSVSDCALSCVSQTDFRCLAFDFCQQGDGKGGMALDVPGKCYYHRNRNAGGQNIQPASGSAMKGVEPSPGGSQTETGCDHYARSYLADYNRVQYRRLADDQLQQMKSDQVDGENVFRCAEMCSTELIDCTAFQFCFNPSSEGAKQKCTFIESKPDTSSTKQEDYSAIVDEAAGKVVKAGKFLEHDTNCHLYAMRRDSSEAHVRDLALGGTMTLAEQEAEAKRRAAGGSLGGGRLFWLFVVVSLVSVVVGLSVSFARDNKETIGRRVRETAARLGL